MESLSSGFKILKLVKSHGFSFLDIMGMKYFCCSIVKIIVLNYKLIKMIYFTAEKVNAIILSE